MNINKCCFLNLFLLFSLFSSIGALKQHQQMIRRKLQVVKTNNKVPITPKVVLKQPKAPADLLKTKVTKAPTVLKTKAPTPAKAVVAKAPTPASIPTPGSPTSIDAAQSTGSPDCGCSTTQVIIIVTGGSTEESSPVAAPLVAPPRPPPSPFPTRYPTRLPTQSPSRYPTPLPTSFPTRYPTPSPTGDPTRYPTRYPTASPTPSPTERPTPSPTRVPTSRRPTPYPTRMPTFNPTKVPTTVPATVLSYPGTPTAYPTTWNRLTTPSVSSEEDTPQPSLVQPMPSAPFSITTFAPSVPSPVPTPQYKNDMIVLSARSVQMHLLLSPRRRRRRLQPTTAYCSDVWVPLVQERIRAYVASSVPHYETLNVLVYNPSSTLQESSAGDNTNTMALVYDVLIRIRSPMRRHEHHMDAYMVGPWDTREKRQSFVEDLLLQRKHGCETLQRVTEVQWIRLDGVGATTASTTDGTTDPSPKPSVAVTIAGIVVALVGAVASVLVCCLCWRCRRQKETGKPDPNNNETNNNNHHDQVDQGFLEINCGSTNDISTLGDPIPLGVQPQSTVVSTSLDYDYQVAFGHLTLDSPTAGAESSAGVTIEELPLNSFIVDDTTTTLDNEQHHPEKQFRVVVPPGPLGLILHANKSDGGGPIVEYVKHSSVLVEHVRAGDCLVSVNDTVVTKFRPDQVSALILMFMSDSTASGLSLTFSRTE